MIPVIFISTVLNIPKFLESDISYYDPWDDFSENKQFSYDKNGTIRVNGTIYKHISDFNLSLEWEMFFDGKRTNMDPGPPGIVITPLRQHPFYMKYYTHWTQLFVKAIIPTILLIYFNYKVNLFLLYSVVSKRQCFNVHFFSGHKWCEKKIRCKNSFFSKILPFKG